MDCVDLIWFGRGVAKLAPWSGIPIRNVEYDNASDGSTRTGIPMERVMTTMTEEFGWDRSTLYVFFSEHILAGIEIAASVIYVRHSLQFGTFGIILPVEERQLGRVYWIPKQNENNLGYGPLKLQWPVLA